MSLMDWIAIADSSLVNYVLIMEVNNNSYRTIGIIFLSCSIIKISRSYTLIRLDFNHSSNVRFLNRTVITTTFAAPQIVFATKSARIIEALFCKRNFVSFILFLNRICFEFVVCHFTSPP